MCKIQIHVLGKTLDFTIIFACLLVLPHERILILLVINEHIVLFLGRRELIFFIVAHIVVSF